MLEKCMLCTLVTCILLFIHVIAREDVVLVVEKYKSNNYMGQFCITNSTNAVTLIHNDAKGRYVCLFAKILSIKQTFLHMRYLILSNRKWTFSRVTNINYFLVNI